ncbi:MAG: hypothetical protein IKV14_01605 [Muribaculaceae bacterium]|nr:hypothetical protein [Muribaculaceae bacterium]
MQNQRENNKFSIRFLLVITFILPFNICFGNYYDIKNELHTNRLALKDNAIWITASKGLLKYDKGLGRVTSASEELGVNSDIEYLSIATAPDNSLWFASEEEGIKKYDEVLSSYRAFSLIGIDTYHGLLYSFAFDSSERVFAGEMDYVFYVDKLNPIDEYPSCKQMYQLATTKDGGNGANRPTMDMAFDSNGAIWIVSDNREASNNYKDGKVNLATLVKKDKASLDNTLNTIHTYPYVYFKATPVLEYDDINATSIVVDNNDNIWFTSNYGIHYYNQSTEEASLMNNTTNSSIPNEHFYANEKDSDGNIWFSSSTTLMKYDGENFTTYTCPDYNEARSILCDGDIVWVLLKNDTLLKFQNNEFETIDLTLAVTGIKESIAEVSNTKAFISNEMLNIENAEGINSVVIYDAMGKIITSANANGATSTQIALSATIKGVLIVKVNNEVVKVVRD